MVNKNIDEIDIDEKIYHISIDEELYKLYRKYKNYENYRIIELGEIDNENKIEKDKKLTQLIQLSKILYKIYKLNTEISKYYDNSFFNANIKEIEDKRENAILLQKLNYTFYKDHNSKLLGLICSSLGITKKELNKQIDRELTNLNIYIDK